MLKFALLIARKDLRIILTRSGGMAQALLLGILLIFIFSLSRETGEGTSPRESAAIFWLGSVFCQVLIFNRLYSLEDTNAAREGLILSALPAQGIWLGKILAALPLLVLAQILFCCATIVFLGQPPAQNPGLGFCIVCAVDLGMCALGSLIAGAAQGKSGRESLLSIILFPMLVPLLLAGIGVGSQPATFDNNADASSWLGIALAFDAIYLATGLLLFGFIYGGDD